MFKLLCSLALILLFSLSSCASLLHRSHAALSDANASRLAVFDDVWETIHQRYYDPTFHGLDWEAERARFRPLAAEARNRAELYSVLRRMLGTLRDAHTRIYSPEERIDWRRPRFISVGISVRDLSGTPVVVAVDRGSDAERMGMRAGDVVTSIDGEPALKVVARRLEERMSASVPLAIRTQVIAALFEGPPDSWVDVTWVSADGKEQATRLRRRWRERDTSLNVRRVRDRIGVVKIDLFTLPIAVEFIRALEGKLRGVRGLVIDLRQNGGGETEAMTEVASAFLPTGKSLGRFIDRSGRVQFEPHTRTAMLFAPHAIRNFNGPLILLTSERTSSAAEIFVAALKDGRRARHLGQATCGCVLAIRRRHTLPDGGELDISEMDYRTPGGARLEGAGLAPDETIPLDREDVRARRDRAIERAIELLK